MDGYPGEDANFGTFYYFPEDAEANFDLEFEDLPDISHSNDQLGGLKNYEIKLIRKRNIRKFNVQGYDYDVHVNAFDRNIEFTNAVQLLHSIISGVYCFVNLSM